MRTCTLTTSLRFAVVAALILLSLFRNIWLIKGHYNKKQLGKTTSLKKNKDDNVDGIAIGSTTALNANNSSALLWHL